MRFVSSFITFGLTLLPTAVFPQPYEKALSDGLSLVCIDRDRVLGERISSVGIYTLNSSQTDNGSHNDFVLSIAGYPCVYLFSETSLPKLRSSNPFSQPLAEIDYKGERFVNLAFSNQQEIVEKLFDGCLEGNDLSIFTPFSSIELPFNASRQCRNTTDILLTTATVEVSYDYFNEKKLLALVAGDLFLDGKKIEW